jgi:hypothetical protein
MPTHQPHSTFDIAIPGESGWLINGTDAGTDVKEYLNGRTMGYYLWDSPVCPFCRCELRQKRFEDRAAPETRWHYNREYVLVWCERCRHWEFEGSQGGNKCMDSSDGVVASSVAAKFEDPLPIGCYSELAQQLRRYPDAWHRLSPVMMEHLITAIFRANYSHSEVIHVGRPGDCGVDVIFVDSEDTRWLIQVKRRAKPRKAEGFSTLQSILGTLALQGERHGIIASSADYFSHQARRERERARQEGFFVEFLDKGILDRMIGTLLPIDPWRNLFAHPMLSYLDSEVRTYFGGDPDQLDLFTSQPDG